MIMTKIYFLQWTIKAIQMDQLSIDKIRTDFPIRTLKYKFASLPVSQIGN